MTLGNETAAESPRRPVTPLPGPGYVVESLARDAKPGHMDQRGQRLIVSFDCPFDNLGFLGENFREMLSYVVRS